MARKSDYNPQGDDDVERGYQKNQMENNLREVYQSDPKPEPKANPDNYEVKHTDGVGNN